jgi:translation initiation factor RLI1
MWRRINQNEIREMSFQELQELIISQMDDRKLEVWVFNEGSQYKLIARRS